MNLSRRNWLEDYQAKKTELEAIGELIRSGDTVFLGSCCGEPQSLVDAFVTRAEALQDVRIVNISPPNGLSPYAARTMSGHLELRTFFGNTATKEAIREGVADYVPCHLSDIPGLFYDGTIPLDLAMVQLSPPDEYGYCSFGISVDCTKAASEKAKTVVAEINSEMPRTLGDSFIHVSEIDYLIETSRPLIEIAFSQDLNNVEKAIGAHVAEVIPDGTTLSLGFGRIIDAVLFALGDKVDLGVHTGTISDGIIQLVEMGVITNRKKTIDVGKIVTTMAMGTRRLYRFCHNNPFVELRPIDYTHNINVLSRFENLISINSAFQVDLYGQVNAEMMDGYHFGGTGGQVDFVRGSKRSLRGKSIICLASTAKGGTVSRIVAALEPYTAVTSLRADIDCVITEYGVAELKGKTIRERASALIGVAHPRFREDLRVRFFTQGPFRPSL